MQKLCEDLFWRFVQVEAVREAKKLPPGGETMKPTVSNLILMCKESDTLEQVEFSMRERFEKKTEKDKIVKSERKRSKGKEAEKIIKAVKENSERLPEQFCEKYHVLHYAPDKAKYEHVYLLHYLNELKYRLRTENEKQREEE